MMGGGGTLNPMLHEAAASSGVSADVRRRFEEAAGYYTPGLVRELLQRHPNLSLSIRPLAPFQGSMLNPKAGVNHKWIKVLREFPDRFVLGSDSFIIASSFKGSEAASMFAQQTQMQRRGMRKLLALLPADVARRIAYENAERIYKLDR